MKTRKTIFVVSNSMSQNFTGAAVGMYIALGSPREAVEVAMSAIAILALIFFAVAVWTSKDKAKKGEKKQEVATAK